MKELNLEKNKKFLKIVFGGKGKNYKRGVGCFPLYDKPFEAKEDHVENSRRRVLGHPNFF